VENNFLNFYDKHKIIPVSQNIEEWHKHLNRRSKLYMQLGIPFFLLQGKNILEVAPGTGHNALATLSCSPSSYTLVEPSIAGFETMKENFNSIIDTNKSPIFLENYTLEEYAKNNPEKRFDIVICEGLIPGLDDKGYFLDALDSMLKQGGILIITCADAISLFFENIRKLLAIVLMLNCDSFESMVDVLLESFTSYFKTLQGASRSAKNWAIDLMLNPASFSMSDFFSIKDALERFGGGYFYYGSSPQFLENYNWYKHLPSSTAEYNQAYIDSYAQKRHNLIHYKEIFDISSGCDFEKPISVIASHVQHSFYTKKIDTDLILESINELIRYMGKTQYIKNALLDCEKIFYKCEFDPYSISTQYPSFASAFGRGQQYLSLVKKGDV